MRWRDHKNNGSITISGDGNDLSHVQDRLYNWVIPASGAHQELKFKVLVQFGSHCVSVGPARGTSFDFTAIGVDHKIVDEKGIHRKFCADRYRLSKNLPGIFDAFLGKKCKFTNHENYMIVELLNESGLVEKYEVFFSVSRQSSAFLRIFVESAYVRDLARGGGSHSQGYKRTIRARVLLAKKLRREPIVKPSA